MPSACTKPDNKASAEASESIKQALNVVDKKVRNLEKRKGKLDGLREQAAGGKPLNEDQLDAVSKYDTVIQNLEFAKDLQKQFISIQVEGEKLLKKQQKRESHEKQQQEIRRIKELLALQTLLDSMGASEVRADFVAGKSGAVKLSDDNLNQLDELYKLISPTREEENYPEQLGVAADHLLSYLDGREKEVAGTTYKDLKSLVEQINETGYFDGGVKDVVEDSVQQTEEELEPEAEPAQPAPEEDLSSSIQQQQLPEVLPEATPAIEQQQPVSNLDFGLGANPDAGLIHHQQNVEALPSQSALHDPSVPMMSEEDTFFSTQQYAHQPRPFNEIVSSVQGSFNFLQDSEIEQAKAQQMDPAVVAAQMAAPGDNSLSFQFQPQESDVTAQSVGSTQFGADIQSSTNQSLETAFSEQTAYAQSLMTQSLQNTAQQYNESAQPTFGTESASFAQMAASHSAAATAGDDNVPPPIPMPGQYDAQNDKKQKTFAMNPNANIFQSMYTQGSSGSTRSDEVYQQSSMSADKPYSTGDNEWSNDQGYSQYNRRGGMDRGNYRGGQGRGGMSNGYRGGNRGGPNPRGRGGMYNGRGGQQGAPRGTTRGGPRGNPGVARGGRGGYAQTARAQ